MLTSAKGFEFNGILFLLLLLLLASVLCPPEFEIRRKFPKSLVNTATDPQPIELHGPTARYLLFDANYGQLSNQRFALVNALYLAEILNVTLVVPLAKVWHTSVPYPEPRSVPSYVLGGRTVNDSVVPHTIIGRYFDYHRATPSTMFLDDFAKSSAFQRLANMAFPMEKTDYSNYLNLSTVPPAPESPRERRLCKTSSGRCTPQLVCRDDPFFREGSFGTEVLLLSRMYSMGNCTRDSKTWLEINHALRPRKIYQDAVDALFDGIDRPTFGVHVRLLHAEEEDGVANGNGAKSFVTMIKTEYQDQLAAAKSVFLAYKPQAPTDDAAKLLFDECKAMNKTVYTLKDLITETNKSDFDDPYSSAMLDLTALSKVDTFAGRMKSTFSISAMYLRQMEHHDTRFYSGSVFTKIVGSESNRTFTCAYPDDKRDKEDLSCQDK